MNNEQDVKVQTDSNTKRLDDFNAAQTIPLSVDLAWKNRGFIKTDFFVAGTGSFSVIGEYHLVIPGSDKNSIALVTPFVGDGPIEAEMTQAYALNNYGSSTSQFDITNPAGTTFRYTWDGTGTDPNINSTTLPVGSKVYIFSANFDAANTNTAARPVYLTTGAGANYFEIDNPTPGVVESNKTLGSGGSITGGPLTNVYELYVSGTATKEFSFVVFLFPKLYIEN